MCCSRGASRKITDYAGKEITGIVPPLVLIPTTAGTGSETTQLTVITDTSTNIKMLLKGQILLPQLLLSPLCTALMHQKE
jgi:alcohol dehydrogenase class IV